MGTDRYVVLGLAQARSSWFRSMSQWTTSGTIPAEFVKAPQEGLSGPRLKEGFDVVHHLAQWPPPWQ